MKPPRPSFFQPAQCCATQMRQMRRRRQAGEAPPAIRKKKRSVHAAEQAKDVTGNYLNNLHGKGTALPQQAQEFFGDRMGQDFSGVKIHTGTEAAQSASAINAQAYAYENHIVFNEGKYNTQSTRRQTPAGS